MNGNRVRWSPNDRLPMQSVDTTRVSGAFALGLGLALCAWLIWLLPQVVEKRDADGVVVLALFGLADVVLILWGLHLLRYKKIVWIDDLAVRVELRTLRGTRVKTSPLAGYEAVVQMDSRIQWWRFSSLLLPDPDPRFSVCLAMTPRGSRDLPELHEHFARLLQLRRETAVWKVE